MPSVSEEGFLFAYRMWRRSGGSTEWQRAARLLVDVRDGGAVVLAQLSWVTEDGAQFAVGFSPNMANCHGHRRTADGAVMEVRGELDAGRDGREDTAARRGYEFDTRVEVSGDWHPLGRLLLLIDDGGEAPLRSVSWLDRWGNGGSVALCSAGPSGSADVTDLVTLVQASAEYRQAGEVAANLVAGSAAAKWLAPDNCATLTFRLSQAVPVDGYVLTSANDVPGRDPVAWTLYGSADGLLWRTLDNRAGQSFGDRHQSRTYLIAEPGSYDHYRLDITANNGAPQLQLGAVAFLAAGSGGFAGYRQRLGQAPVAFRGTRVAAESPDTRVAPLPHAVPVPPGETSFISAPGFPSNTLDARGTPIWVSELAHDEPNHILHVVRDLEPAAALEALGAQPRHFRPCELPIAKPDGLTSMPAAALGVTSRTSAVLLSGRVGAWTFVYDDSGFTSMDGSIELSADGRTAATSMYFHYADIALTYAVDGRQLHLWTTDDLDLTADLAQLPADLRAAFDAAGTTGLDEADPGRPDDAILMRVACALAGLVGTLDDLRRIPLLATVFG